MPHRLIPTIVFSLVACPVLANQIDFAAQVAPIFRAHCIRCHNDAERSGELSLSTSKDLTNLEFVTPGKPVESVLLNAIVSSGGEPPTMPKEGESLSSEQIDVIREWIAQGARWPEEIVVRAESKADASWWSLQPISHPPPPTTAGHESEHPIDKFVRARLSEQGLLPSPAADRRTLIRRLYFDLVGLPPTPTEVADFVMDDDPGAYEALVDRLLDSPRLGERWARHWLDIAHYADTHGFERDKLRDNAWRYRDYVIRAFNDDKPYDQFLREQIAGDIIAPEDEDSVVATGFLAAGPWDFVGQVETKSPVLKRAARSLDLDDMVTQVMTATMAMTVNCSRCHDHKLDPITQREYYQLTAVFAGLERGDRDISSTARQAYDSERERLKRELARIGSEIGRLEGRAVDLADVVGGGNGFGTGKKGLGIDARTGQIQERPFGDLGNVNPGNFASCSYDFVDGVFVPANEQTKISSTDLVAHGLPKNSGKAWDMIRNGPVASQFSTKLGELDFNADGHSMIGLHANAGITFDLRAIRAAIWPHDPDGSQPATLRFSTTAGYGGRTIEPSAEFWILVDGRLSAHQKVGRNDAIPVAVELSSQATFLTLISTDGGDGYGHDQISFGDPRLQVVARDAQMPDTDEKLLADLRETQDEVSGQLASLGEPPVFFGVNPKQPAPVHILLRGNPETPGDSVPPGALGWKTETITFGDESVSEAARRLALADWIVDPRNPLTARVIVNRLWHWHFGRGIVSTPSDFGYGGSPPTHPELLDWLASKLIQDGWSLKAIHRLIVTSETYQQTSRVVLPDAVSVDTDNQLLWRMNPRRLEAEVIRDSVLAVTGNLNQDMFGPGYRDFDYEEAYAPIYRYKTADSPELWRRSVYRFIVRTTPPQFMTALDCPDPANLTPKRNVTTTPLQSLAMFNNDFMLRQSRYFAERLENESSSLGDQIDLAFQLAFNRPPTADERSAAQALVERLGLLHFCRALLNANEFVYVD
ncbi:MAG: DUF1553 domain-containing protein [Planctomycetaceae bacterium]|nr:DUF1553 domain-containing protein [Planctomycetales bacterium]MCB9927060.1 DUF1553 domain-containing protein [Planctomycetaceae bacterium]